MNDLIDLAYGLMQSKRYKTSIVPDVYECTVTKAQTRWYVDRETAMPVISRFMLVYTDREPPPSARLAEAVIHEDARRCTERLPTAGSSFVVVTKMQTMSFMIASLLTTKYRLAAQAIGKVFQRRQTQFGGLTAWLGRQMAGVALTTSDRRMLEGIARKARAG